MTPYALQKPEVRWWVECVRLWELRGRGCLVVVVGGVARDGRVVVAGEGVVYGLGELFMVVLKGVVSWYLCGLLKSWNVLKL